MAAADPRAEAFADALAEMALMASRQGVSTYAILSALCSLSGALIAGVNVTSLRIRLEQRCCENIAASIAFHRERLGAGAPTSPANGN